MKLLFITPSFVLPSGRFRVCQFVEPLRGLGHEVTVRRLTPDRFWLPRNPHSVLGRCLSRGATFLRLASYCHVFRDVEKYDLVFMNRDLVPEVRISFLEPLLKKRNPKLIFDFDDAIHLGSRRAKLEKILPFFAHIVAGNEYLAEFARMINPEVSIWPTVINTELYRPRKERRPGPFRIGWMGSRWTMTEHLPILESVMEQLARELDFEFYVISDSKPAFTWRGVKLLYKPWRAESEISDLQQFDVGLMPLPDEVFARGKCGCKVIQYMGVGIPVLASPVGSNGQIVVDGVTGFLCRNEQDWLKRVKQLYSDEALRKGMGEEGYRRAVTLYSIQSLLPMIEEVFRDVISQS